MAWITLHQELRDHPKAKRLARSLDIAMPHAIGHLACLWLWCISYAPDGDLSHYTAGDVADAAGWEGDPEVFVAALTEAPAGRCGFIERTDDTMNVHDWHQYGGKLLEKKQRNASRMKAARADHDPSTAFAQDGTCKACGEHVLPDEVTRADHVQRTCIARVHDVSCTCDKCAQLEKRREEKKRNKKPPKSPMGGPAFEAFWAKYPNKTSGKAMGLKSWTKINPDENLVAVIMAGLTAALESRQWQKDSGEFIPMATTWLNQRRWEAVFAPPLTTAAGQPASDGPSAFDVFAAMAKNPEAHSKGELAEAAQAAKASEPTYTERIDTWLAKQGLTEAASVGV